MASGPFAALARRLLPQRTRIGAGDLLWSKGVARHCDVAGPDDYWRDATEAIRCESFFREHHAGAHGLVWVRLGSAARIGRACDLDHFVAGALPHVRRPFALVTTDGDVSVPGELRPATVAALLDCPWLVAWHTQNLDRRMHPKLAPIPVGLDLHTRPEGMHEDTLAATLARLRAGRRAWRGPPRVFCDLGVTLSSPERGRALRALKGCAHVDFQRSHLPRGEIWRRYAAYPFALSTLGHGLDCHRTWELLYLGTIVVTRTSPLDPLFEGLPVAIVDDWPEVLDPARLEAWHRRLAPLTERAWLWDRLHPRRWIDPIRAAVRAASYAGTIANASTS